MLAYEISEADLASVPASYRTEPRYLGYRQADRAKPYAGFFREDTLPVRPHVAEALPAGMAPTEYGYRPSDAGGVRVPLMPVTRGRKPRKPRKTPSSSAVSCSGGFPWIRREGSR
jgi:hypothetical protein